MTSYKDAGVNIREGDRASALAYKHATATFASRRGMIGAPVQEEDGYAGLLDMGDYYLVQSDDSTGTKIDLAFDVGTFDTLGYDLVAMVADDAVCTGAEPISISNTLDTPKIKADVVDGLMKGLSAACTEQKIVVPAGEIAEVPGAVERGVWSATVVGIVEKEKVLKPQTIAPGDAIIALRSNVARSNGFSLIRHILSEQFGPKWVREEWKNGMSWGEIFLTPSRIYAAALLTILGRYKQERKVHVKGLAHITGGGIPSKLARILKHSGCGAELPDLWPPHEALTDLIQLGAVAIEEAYRTWNMGNGMLVILPAEEASRAINALCAQGMEARQAGVVSQDPTIALTTAANETLEFDAR